MLVYGQLIKAKVEQTASDLAETISGLIWHNTTSKKIKFYDGAAVREVADTSSTQTLAGKTLTSPVLNSPSVVTPSRLDPKKDTKANLVTYAATPATNGELCYATDEEILYVVQDGLLVLPIATPDDESVTDAKLSPTLQDTLATIISNYENFEGLEIVAGTVQQNSSDKTKWEFISDSDHQPTGFEETYNTPTGNLLASGTSLTVNYKRDYSKVVAFIVGTDETLATYGISIGASVGLDKVVLNASMNIDCQARVHYNGSTFTIANSKSSPFEFSNPVVSGSTLTLTTPAMPNVPFSALPWSQNNAVAPLIPVQRDSTTTTIRLQWYDYTGASVGTLSTNMSCTVERRYHGKVWLDGVAPYNEIPFYSTGNIWMIGIFQK